MSLLTVILIVLLLGTFGSGFYIGGRYGYGVGGVLLLVLIMPPEPA